MSCSVGPITSSNCTSFVYILQSGEMMDAESRSVDLEVGGDDCGSHILLDGKDNALHTDSDPLHTDSDPVHVDEHPNCTLIDNLSMQASEILSTDDTSNCILDSTSQTVVIPTIGLHTPDMTSQSLVLEDPEPDGIVLYSTADGELTTNSSFQPTFNIGKSINLCTS